MLSRYQHLLWDWNGTLLNDLWLNIAAMNAVLARRQLPLLDENAYRRVFTFPVRNYYAQIGLDLTRETFEDLSVEFMANYESRIRECTLFEQARPILRANQAAGLKQSILSAYPHDRLVKIIAQFELAPCFENLLGLADIYAHSKVELAARWMHAQGYRPGEVVLIGDTSHDFEVAAAIGADCLLIAAGHNSRARLEQCGVPVLNSLGDLLTPA